MRYSRVRKHVRKKKRGGRTRVKVHRRKIKIKRKARYFSPEAIEKLQAARDRPSQDKIKTCKICGVKFMGDYCPGCGNIQSDIGGY